MEFMTLRSILISIMSLLAQNLSNPRRKYNKILINNQLYVLNSQKQIRLNQPTKHKILGENNLVETKNERPLAFICIF